MLKQTLAMVLCAAMTATGCASAAGPRVVQTPQAPSANSAVMADYVQRIPAGSKVRVERTAGSTLRGTLMKASAESITLQRNTRVPEPPIDIPLATVARVTVDNGSSAGKNIAIGVASGVGATFGVLLLLFAIWAD